MVFLRDHHTDIEELRTEFNNKFNICESGVGIGAQFWVYISEENDTSEVVKDWQVTIRHHYENWNGTITAEKPRQILQTPNLSGIFHVSVKAKLGEEIEMREIEPQNGSNRNIGCNSNYAAMIGIEVSPSGKEARYWTIWDAVNMSEEEE
ncbi:MAG TPA: hypothetical protein PKY59_11085 [Pyrinomonadaceae bacterium]|nr:hypothetical protein [Pyrinomonadaceae bacterium]